MRPNGATAGNISDRLPLLEIPDEERRIDLAKEVLPFITNVFAVHDRRLGEETISKALDPIFEDKDMIKTIFDEKYDQGFADSEARGEVKWKAEGKIEKGREMLLKILRKKFNKVPKDEENKIGKVNDPVALDS